MYVRGGARLPKLLWQDRWWVLLLIGLAVATELLEPHVARIELFSVVYVGVLSAALSIFLVFRFNEAYERWWEARKLWGGLVNLSRDFARQSLTLLSEDQVRAEGKRLIYGQIAFVHALRLRLRDDGPAEAADTLRRFLPEAAVPILESENIPSAVLRAQSGRLAAMLRGSTDDRIVLTRFDTTISGLNDVQGGCERIKTTVFPSMVRAMSTVFVWGTATLIPIVFLEPDQSVRPVEFCAVFFICRALIVVKQLGFSLMDTFENADNDIPMTALCRTIERDLRGQLGESNLPPSIQPSKGVLL